MSGRRFPWGWFHLNSAHDSRLNLTYHSLSKAAEDGVHRSLAVGESRKEFLL
jgi:hypothetical protein